MPSYEAIQNILTLYKVDPRTGFPTGEVKPNDPEDPDYIAPIEGGTCPVIYTEWVPTDPSCETNYIFENVLLCDDFTKSDCPEHYHGSVETYCVPAGTYFSALSQEDADQKALDDIAANGQAYADAEGSCIEDTRYYNTIRTGDFTRNNCAVHYSGTLVTYTVPADTYFTYTSVSDANVIADADIAANGQAYANANGSCIEDEHWFNVLYTENFTRNNCGVGFYGSVVTYTVPANTHKSYVSQLDADNMAVADAAANGQTYANANGICTADGEFSNVYASDTFTKDDCSVGYHGSDVLYEVPAGTYTSLISQIDADAQAAADIAANGQAYANTNGICIPDTYAFKWIVDPDSDYCEDDSDLL